MRSLATVLLSISLAAMTGCYADDGPPPQYAAAPGGAPPGYAAAPDGEPPQYAATDDGDGDLVEVSPGVEVVADYDEAVFFADDYYWVNRGGFWYWSRWYGGGWGRAGWVPDHIRGIRNPEGFRHYRPAGWAGHEHVRGGYEAHAQYHAAHGAGSVHVRAAVHGGGHGGGHHR